LGYRWIEPVVVYRPESGNHEDYKGGCCEACSEEVPLAGLDRDHYALVLPMMVVECRELKARGDLLGSDKHKGVWPQLVG